MSEPRVYHVAQCHGCGTPPTLYTSPDERTQWIKDHKATTGHGVITWLEAR